MSESKIKELNSMQIPCSFREIANPIGWDYAKEPDGEQTKYPQQKIIEEGPSEDILCSINLNLAHGEEAINS